MSNPGAAARTGVGLGPAGLCSHGRLDLAPTLTIDNHCSACVVAAAKGYPTATRTGDAINLSITTDAQLQLFHAGTRRDPSGTLVSSGGACLRGGPGC